MTIVKIVSIPLLNIVFKTKGYPMTRQLKKTLIMILSMAMGLTGFASTGFALTRDAIGKDFPLIVRMNGNDFMPGGNSRAELQEYARALSAWFGKHGFQPWMA